MIAPIVAAVGLSACGSGAHGPAVVRVGDQAISRASVDHWTGIIERGGTAGSSLAPEKGTARRRALEFLISCQWLIGEAAMQGAPVSDHAVERALVERREANGRAEFEHQLHETGRSVDDASLEARAELAAAAIRQRLSRRADAVGDAQVASFHAHNLRLFRRREVRKVELIENLRSRSAAEALVRRIGSGEAFSKRAYHEELAENTDLSPGTQTKTALVKAIFAARANVVSKPMPLNHAWTVFVVRNIVTATARPLADVRGEVVEKLTALRRQRITAAFAKEYEARWRARTHCRSGYVVQRCAEYSGQMTANADPFAGG
jgi:foldase protein PrsA